MVVFGDASRLLAALSHPTAARFLGAVVAMSKVSRTQIVQSRTWEMRRWFNMAPVASQSDVDCIFDLRIVVTVASYLKAAAYSTVTLTQHESNSQLRSGLR